MSAAYYVSCLVACHELAHDFLLDEQRVGMKDGAPFRHHNEQLAIVIQKAIEGYLSSELESCHQGGHRGHEDVDALAGAARAQRMVFVQPATMLRLLEELRLAQRASVAVVADHEAGRPSVLETVLMAREALGVAGMP